MVCTLVLQFFKQKIKLFEWLFTNCLNLTRRLWAPSAFRNSPSLSSVPELFPESGGMLAGTLGSNKYECHCSTQKHRQYIFISEIFSCQGKIYKAVQQVGGGGSTLSTSSLIWPSYTATIFKKVLYYGFLLEFNALFVCLSWSLLPPRSGGQEGNKEQERQTNRALSSRRKP